MKPGDEILNIYFRDNDDSANLIDVLFVTEKGMFVFHDFEVQQGNNIDIKKWAKFEKLNNCINGNKVIKRMKLENDLSLIIELENDWFICLYFMPSNSGSIYSDHILDLFQRSELSDSFFEGFDELDDL